MYTISIISTIFAWFIGLLIDANTFSGQYLGFFHLRTLFPLIVMGIFILKAIKDLKK